MNNNVTLSVDEHAADLLKSYSLDDIKDTLLMSSVSLANAYLTDDDREKIIFRMQSAVCMVCEILEGIHQS